jgi:hypothetical protein
MERAFGIEYPDHFGDRRLLQRAQLRPFAQGLPAQAVGKLRKARRDGDDLVMAQAGVREMERLVDQEQRLLPGRRSARPALGKRRAIDPDDAVLDAAAFQHRSRGADRACFDVFARADPLELLARDHPDSLEHRWLEQSAADAARIAVALHEAGEPIDLFHGLRVEIEFPGQGLGPRAEIGENERPALAEDVTAAAARAGGAAAAGVGRGLPGGDERAEGREAQRVDPEKIAWFHDDLPLVSEISAVNGNSWTFIW